MSKLDAPVYFEIATPIVRTKGVLEGTDVVRGARTAEEVAALIAKSPRSKAASGMAAAELNRSINRSIKRGVDPNTKSPKVTRIERHLKKLGVKQSLADIARNHA